MMIAPAAPCFDAFQYLYGQRPYQSRLPSPLKGGLKFITTTILPFTSRSL